jgi:hypothetical protein
MDAKRQDLMQRHHAQCGPALAQPPEARPACAAAGSDWEHERITFEERMRAKREAFEASWRARWEEQNARGYDEDAMARFKQESMAARAAFEDEMRAEYEAWHRAHGQPMPCGHVLVVAREDCQPERLRLEAGQFEALLREKYLGTKASFEAFQLQMEARMQAFHQERAERRKAFLAQEPTEEERGAFEAEERAALESFQRAMDEERVRFGERARAHHEEVQLRLRAEMEDFLRAQRERCWGEAKPLTGQGQTGPAEGAPAQPASAPTRRERVRTVQDELEEERLRCMLEVRVQMQEFETQQLREFREFMQGRGSDELRRFEMNQLEARKAFEVRLMSLRAVCEEGLREDHQLAVAEAHQGASPLERLGSFAMEEGDAEVRIRGAHVGFKGDKATEAIYGFTVDGQLWLDAIRKETPFTDFDVEDHQEGSVMAIQGQGLRYRFHDNPTGVINLQVKEGTIELDVADYLQASAQAKGVELTDGKVRALVRGSDVVLDGDRITLRGEATFLVLGAEQEVLAKVANKHRGEIARAVDEKRVAAEVTIVAGSQGVEADRLTYEDMAIEVEPKAKGVVSVRIDNPRHEGRTVVLNLEKGLLADLARVQVKVFDVEGGSERPAGVSKASSLADVLDPTDDSGMEWWLVTDEDGAQVLVSFTHFSEKRVEIQSASSGLSPVPGFDALLLLGALGAAVMVLRRR